MAADDLRDRIADEVADSASGPPAPCPAIPPGSDARPKSRQARRPPPRSDRPKASAMPMHADHGRSHPAITAEPQPKKHQDQRSESLGNQFLRHGPSNTLFGTNWRVSLARACRRCRPLCRSHARTLPWGCDEPMSGNATVVRGKIRARPETARPASPRKGASPRQCPAEKARLDPGQGPHLRRLQEDPRHPAREEAGDGLRRGRLPQRRRMLVPGPRHHDDHGRDLHARLLLLQRRHRQAQDAGRVRTGPRGPCRRRAWA